MAEKNLTTRIKHKTDTSANWAKAVNFVPLKGEIIVYSDLKKIKVGDGTTKVNSLQFLADSDTHQAVVDKNPTLSWGTKSTVATIGGTSINVTMPANPNSHQSIKTLKTDNTAAQATSAGEAIAGSGTINLHKVAKTGSYTDLNNKPAIPDISNLVPYTGATKSVNLGSHSLSMVRTILTANDTTTTISPDSIYMENPGGTFEISGSDVNLNGISCNWPNPTTQSGDTIATIGNLNSHAGIDKVGTVTSVAVKMNGSTKGTVTSSGTIDLGTVLTSHQPLSGYMKVVSNSNGVMTITY